MNQTHPKLSVRCQVGNPNQHLWNNHGTWWCHLRVHLPGLQKERLRLSMETGELEAARKLRDALFALFGADSRGQAI